MSVKPLCLGVALAVGGAAVLSGSPAYAAAQTANGSKRASSTHSTQTRAAEIAALQAQLQAGQAQIGAMQAQLQALQQKVTQLQAQQQEQQQTQAKVAAAAPPPVPQNLASTHTKDTGITVGGKIAFLYGNGTYDDGVHHRRGDVKWDNFDLTLNGKVHGVLLSAQWRWYQYMSAIRWAWIGYDFTPASQLQLGFTQIPFGNLPFNSHSWFESSNFYVGLEDTDAAGVKYIYSKDPWNVQLAFFKNDTTGGVGGGGRTDSYSYNILGIRAPGEGLFDAPAESAGSIDSMAARTSYTFKPTTDLSVDLGLSGLYGGLQGATSRLGHYYAGALSANANYKRWNFQLQATRYSYTTNNRATELAVGAYDFYDTIAAKANIYTGNVAYNLPVSWGPIDSLLFYNDYSIVNNKSGGLHSTTMDVIGVGVTAGDVYTSIDYAVSKNQPFVGGSMAGPGNTLNRFNMEVTFAF